MGSFFHDHNVIKALSLELRSRGHAVMIAREAGLDRASDQEILTVAGSLGLIVVTGDRDFADLHQGGRITHAGILLIRPQSVPRLQDRGKAMADAIEELLASGWPLHNQLYRFTAMGWTLG